MKPSFALNLTDDGIALLHRTSRGWMMLGDTPFANPDLAEAMGYLRRTALGLEPRGMTTKLVIPNSEVLYTDVAAPGPDAASRRKQIKAALEGRTPYPVSDLVFDWWGKGPTVQVAVVARETLEQAEAFAREHRFNPVSFVAIPPEGSFGAEPYFGPAAGVAALLRPGEKVDRDQDPIVIVARDTPRAASPEAAPVAAVAPVEDVPPLAEAAPAPLVAEAAPEPAAPEETEHRAAESVVPEAALPETAAPETVAPETALADTALPEDAAPEAVTPAWIASAFMDPPVAPPEPVAAAPTAPVEVMAENLPPPAPLVTAPEVTMPLVPAAPVPEVTLPPAKAAAPDPAPVEAVPPLLTPRATPVRDRARDDDTPRPADRMAQRIADRASDTRASDTRASDTRASDTRATPRAAVPDRFGDPAGFASRRGGGDMPVPRAVTATGGALGPAAAGAGRSPRLAVRGAAGDDPVAVPPLLAHAPTRPAAAKPPVTKVTSLKTAMVTANSIPLPRDRKPAPEAAEKPPEPERAGRKAKAEPASMTRFGSRGAPQRGKPRYLGLILTGVLLLLLAAVAAWSSFYLAARNDAADAANAVAAAPPVVAPSPLAAAEAVAPGPDDEMLADLQDPADFPAEAPAPAPVEAAPAAELAAVPPVVAEPAAPAEAEPVAEAPAPPAPEAATVPQPGAVADLTRNPTVEPQDEIYLATIEPRLSTSDASALAPPLTATDALPPAQPAPPPFGTLYQFDAAGLIVATPEGIVTPEGVRLVAGRPPVEPPPRPAAPAAEPATAALPGDAAAASLASDAGQVVEEAAPEAAAFADPALQDARPRARPEGLTPPPAAADDDAALPAETDSRLTSLRPLPRPAALLAADAAAQTAAEQAAAASLVASAEAAGPVSPLAVAVSRKPAARPQNFDAAVEAAVAAAVRDAPPAPAVVAAPEPEAVPEPVPEPVLASAAAAIAPAARPAPEPEPEPEAKPARRATPEEEEAPEPFSIEVDEPELASAAPSGPTRSTVAKQATFKRAINLSKINLIGVYGSASNRYALVRQPTGRYVKVAVGDRLDGGKVSAISEREVKYVKSGRTLSLAMPKT